MNINIGVRAHDFAVTDDVENLSKIISKTGARSIQLALKKSLTGFNTDTGNLSQGMARYIRDSLYKYGINISVLGCYVNLIHPDKTERRNAIEKFKEHIRFAKDFGCNLVGTETGSLNADYSYNEDNKKDYALKLFLESLFELVEEAEKFGVFVGIEGVTKHTINTPERMHKVLETVNSNNLQVIFDPVNLIDETNYKDQDNLVDKSFELFGDKINIIHAKDFIVKDNKLKVVPAGFGEFNYEKFIKILKDKKPFIDILLENSSKESVDTCMKKLNSY
jgi:sugar phosphate isomerase/epimerase